MTSVALRSLWGYWVALLLVGLGLFALNLLVVYTFQALGGLERVEDLMELLPEGVKALLKSQGGFATTATDYVAVDYRHPVYLIALVAYVIGASSGAVSREVERGTILLLLACPIARWRWLLAKGGALAAGILVLLAVAWMGTWVGSLVTEFGDQMEMLVFVQVQANAFALALAIGGYALLISALSSDGGHTTALATGITVVMFFMDFLAMLWSPAAFLGPFSVFHYYDPLGVSQAGAVPWRDVGVLLGVAAVGFTLALVGFQRRDITR